MKLIGDTDLQIELDLEILVFEEREKLEYPEKNLLERGQEPTTNSTHIFILNKFKKKSCQNHVFWILVHGLKLPVIV